MSKQTQTIAVDGATQRLAGKLFRTMRHTFINRGLCQQRKDGSIREVDWIGWIPWFERRACAFVLDTGTLPVSLEKLTDPRVVHQVSTALGGRAVEVTNHRGVLWAIGMDLPPLATPRPRRRLPRQANLDLGAIPGGRFMVPLGVSHDGPVWRSLADLDCMLVGGTRGGGKTTLLFGVLAALLTRHGPGELQLAIVDPKGFDFLFFDGVPHLWADRATGADDATRLLNNLVVEMEDRGRQFTRVGVRSLDAFNATVPEPLPLLLVVIDEVTDLVLEAGRQGAALQRKLGRLVSKGRAAGIMLIVATQNPKSEVFNTLVRGNFKTRIAFPVPERDVSRTILNRAGAERLPNVPGRMLALTEGLNREPLELQGFYLDDETVKTITAGLANRQYSRLTNLEQELVLHTIHELDGSFHVDNLAQAFQGHISSRKLKKLARSWERRGWLTPFQVGRSRQITDSLLAELEGVSGSQKTIRRSGGSDAIRRDPTEPSNDPTSDPMVRRDPT